MQFSLRRSAWTAPAVLAIILTVNGCATTVVDTDRLNQVVPDIFNCEYELDDDTQTWRCGDKGLFAADYDVKTHDDVVQYWIDTVVTESPIELTTEKEGNVPPLEHEGKKYALTMIRFLTNGRTVVRTVVMTSPKSGGQRGWACMASALTSEDDLGPWCGKFLKGMVMSQK